MNETLLDQSGVGPPDDSTEVPGLRVPNIVDPNGTYGPENGTTGVGDLRNPLSEPSDKTEEPPRPSVLLRRLFPFVGFGESRTTYVGIPEETIYCRPEKYLTGQSGV